MATAIVPSAQCDALPLAKRATTSEGGGEIDDPLR